MGRITHDLYHLSTCDSVHIVPHAISQDFLFGASTSSYQIEGGNSADGRGPSIWDTFCRSPGKIKDGRTGDPACDHYRRYREDVALMREAGLEVYRFSMAWSRIFPHGRGALNQAGLDFYCRLTDELLANGIQPWPCFYHWDLPQALQDRGGWPNRDTAGWFTDYVETVAERLRDRVDCFVLLNEPSIVAVEGHLMGRHAPGLKDMDSCLAAAHHLNLATGRGTQAVRSVGGDLQVGTVLALNRIEPASDREADEAAARTVEAFLNGVYLDPLLLGRYPQELAEAFSPLVQDGDLETIQQRIDFLGMNHYTRVLAEARPGGRIFGAGVKAPGRGRPVTAMGWEIYPDGLRQELHVLKERYGNPPVYITENGAAFEDEPGADGTVHDGRRIDYLRAYLEACLAAREEGVEVRGFLVWSLLDNFEWAYGYTKRFGIVRVDFETQERTPKDSFHWYKQLLQERQLD